MDPERKLEFACKALDRILGFFPRADGRAQVLLGIDLAMLYALAINAPALYAPWWSIALLVVSTVLLGLSLWNLYKVFFPQLAGPELSLIYFHEIRRLSRAEYAERFSVETVEAHTKDVLGQVWRNSEILTMKFASLRDAMLSAAGALPFWLCALLVSAVTKGQVVLK